MDEENPRLALLSLVVMSILPLVYVPTSYEFQFYGCVNNKSSLRWLVLREHVSKDSTK